MSKEISFVEFIEKMKGAPLSAAQAEIIKYIDNGGNLSMDICKAKLDFNRNINNLHNHYIINGVHGPECPCFSKI